MVDSQEAAFVLVAAVLTVTPGADTMLVLRNALRGGRSLGWATTLGVLSGVLLHALMSAVGLSIILTRSAAAFQMVKTLGPRTWSSWACRRCGRLAVNRR